MPRDRRDITTVTEEGSFKFRVAALIVHEGRLLLAGTRYESYHYLPGGKVRLGEDSRAAVARELREETALRLEIGDLRHIVENLRSHPDGGVRHELMLVYTAPWPDDLPSEAATASPLPGHRLIWVPSDALESKRFQPRPLAAMLSCPPAGSAVRHTIIDSRQTPSAPRRPN